MMRLSGPAPDDVVLDVACGTGMVSCEFAPLVSHVTGIDLTPAMIEQAKKAQAEKQLGNLTWMVGDVSKELPFDDSSFSIVVTRYSLHHLLEPAKVVQEMKRVCREKGKVLIIDVAPDTGNVDSYNQVEKLRDPSYAEALTLVQLENIICGAGLTVYKTARHDLEVELELEDIFHASHPNSGDANRVRQKFEKDLIKNNLGMRSHMKEGRIHFYFPISMVLCKK